MSKSELDFLNDVREYSNRIFFLLNKADYLDEKNLRESIVLLKPVRWETELKELLRCIRERRNLPIYGYEGAERASSRIGHTATGKQLTIWDGHIPGGGIIAMDRFHEKWNFAE